MPNIYVDPDRQPSDSRTGRYTVERRDQVRTCCWSQMMQLAQDQFRQGLDEHGCSVICADTLFFSIEKTCADHQQGQP